MSEYKPSILDTRPNIDTGYISKLLTDVFGVQSPVYVPWFHERDYHALPFTDVKEGTAPGGVALPYSNVEVKSQDAEDRDAPVRFGQKVFGYFSFNGGLYKTWDYKGNPVDIQLGDLLMPLASLIEFTRQKTVMKTPTLGGLGTVKEIYGFEDWNISITGIILPDNLNKVGHQTVSEQITAIQLFHDVAGPIDVSGPMFSQRNITRIVTESLKFSPVQGRPNMVQYSIDAISDSDLLLTDVMR